MHRYKYPRTPHLPWSNGTPDDIRSRSLPWNDDTEVVATLKLDGECTSIYPDGYIHARSTTYSPHWSRSMLKARALTLAMGLGEGEVLIGENLYAQHSIPYSNLEDYFYLFGVRDHAHFWSWDSVVCMAKSIGVPTPDVLYRGPACNLKHDSIWPYLSPIGAAEGYVVRTAAPFTVDTFHLNVCKYVRPNHVTTTDHWLYDGTVTINQLREDIYAGREGTI